MTTIAQVIAARGINEQHALRNLRRRTRYRIGHDRLKVWAGSGECLYGYSYRKEDIDRDDAALATLKTTTNIAEYVRAWCILNRLVL
jgi:hypothetical protein